MNVLFVYLPRDCFFIDTKSRCIFPPLGLMYLSSMLERNGQRATIVDLRADDKYELKRRASHADMVGIRVESTSLANCRQAVETLREYDPELPVIIGGPHCTIVKEKALESLHADYLIAGEAEHAILSLIDVVEGHTDGGSVPGLYRMENGEVHGNGIAIVENLDELPFPAYHLVTKYDYGYMDGVKIFPGKFMSVSTSRGCPSHCRFCARNSLVPKFRMRSAENVLDELSMLREKGYKNVTFVDDNFLADRKRVGQIMDGVIREEMDMNFIIEGARADTADRELYEKMKRAGVRLIIYGIESGNQDVLNYYRKGITIEHIRKAVELADEMGFLVLGNFILGAPMETEEHFRNTIDFAKSLPLDMASFFILDYMVGSELWEEAVKKGIIREDEYIVEGGTRHGMGKFTRSELEKWRERADREFYMRKGYIAHEFRKFLSLRKPYMLKCAETLFACTRCLRKSSKHRNTERECSN